MPEIILRFQRIDTNAEFDAPIPVSVHFEGTDTEAFNFVNPLTDKNLSELRWYLESYWQWPSDIDDGRAREVEGNLPKWGKSLLHAVIQKSPDAMRLFGRFSEAQGERMLTIDTTEPRILRLPWELLRDEGGYLFSEKISVRRRMHKVKPHDIQPFDLPVRILMVTCRPDGAGFIDPRSIATPLLDALDSLPEDFEVEFLRPPTLKALDERLRDETKPRVHIVHFDGHGVYNKTIGLGFLLFEDDEYKGDPVDAEQLGTLLNKSGIPLMVLNACQSAQPDDRNPFASVASRLIESGVGGVVAMNYSVLVETAKRFTKEFYGALARGQSTNAAMDTARRDLFRDTKRITLRRPHEEEAIIIHLQDWFLPALYQQADELTPFAPLSPSTAPSSKGKGAGGIGVSRAKFPPPPLHGFHGRARELLDLERAFATRNIVVLHGFGGQGKTSLATQAAEWFTRTHLFERAAFISFETGASLDFVLNELGNALVEDNFQIYQGNKIEAIAKSIQEKPALVVFDNFESVLPNGNAPLPADELKKLLDAAATWFAPHATRSTLHSALLITTRNPEIPHPAFTPGTNCLHKELSGLAASDALELAASILEAYSLPRPPRVPLEELLAFLKGHPLSLQLALPQLRGYSAGQLVEQYQSILPHMKRSEKQERNESLEVSLRFSLDRLGADALNWLSRLWIFEGGAMEHVLLGITEIPAETWNALKPQLTSTALIRVEEIPGVNVPFIHFHPTLAPYLKAINDNSEPDNSILDNSTAESRVSNIESRYWQGYYQLANQLYQLDTQHPMQARAIVLRELPNLKRALKRTLAAGALDKAVDFAVRLNMFLDYFGRWRERDEIAAEVDRYTRTQVNTDGKITKREYLMESGRGQRLLQQGRAGEAEKVFRALLSRLEGDAGEWGYETTVVFQFLGRCLRAQGRPSQASDYYRRAVALAEKLEQTKDILNHTGKLHNDLADAFADMGKYAEAKDEYQKALDFKKQADDERGQGVTLGQLGTLAMTQGDLNEARKRYLEALSLFQRMGEDQMEAVAWHQLGRVAQEARDWDEAERCYKQSITINEGLGNLSQAAATCNQFAIVAENAGRPQEAERWYLRAIELKEKYSTPSDLASSLSNLADLYLSQNRLDEAEIYARRALAIEETLDPSAAEIWKDYSFFAQLAEKRGRMDEVREWRRKEQESFAAFAGSDTQMQKTMQTWQPRIDAIVLAVGGDEDARKAVEQLCDKLAEIDDWKNIAVVIRRILNGERGIELLESVDRTDAYIVRRILQALNGEGDPHPPTPSPREASRRGKSRADLGEGEPPQQQGLTLPQLLELVERAVADGDQKTGSQLFPAMQKMASDPTAPREMQLLGKALAAIIIGDKNPSLDGLPDEVASAVRGLLGRLKNK